MSTGQVVAHLGSSITSSVYPGPADLQPVLMSATSAFVLSSLSLASRSQKITETGENRMKEPKGPGHTTPLHPHAQATGQADTSKNRRKSVGDPGWWREPPVSREQRRHSTQKISRKCGSGQNPIRSAAHSPPTASSTPAPPPTTPAALLAPMLEWRGRPGPRPGAGKGVRHSAIIIVRPQSSVRSTDDNFR